MSWKLEASRERLDSKVISAIMEQFSSSNENQLRFRDLHAGLVTKKLTTQSNQRKTSLYLTRLVEKGVLEKLPTGLYSLKMSARDYEAFAYMNWMKEQYGNKGLTRSFGVGGMFSRESQGTLVPFVGQTTKFDEYLLSELGMLLSSIFSALKDLRNKVLLQSGGYQVGYSQAIMRQGLLAIAANIVGREDITNYEVYRYLEGLTIKRRSDKKGNREITLHYMNKRVREAFSLWKTIFYDIYGENSVDEQEDVWVSMWRRNGESLDEIGKMLIERKAELKKKSFDLDRLSLAELRERRQKFDEETRAKMKPPTKRSGISGYLFSPQEQELSSNLDGAIGIKWIEVFLKNQVDWEDFAILVTTPPEVLSKYNTILHELKEKVTDWKSRCPIDNELLRFFASELLTRDLTALQRPGAPSLIGLTESQLEKLIDYWRELRKEWTISSQKFGENELLFHEAKPQVRLSEEKEKLLFADLQRDIKNTADFKQGKKV